MSNRLYLSFWDICLENLPVGRFERRNVPPSEAAEMIRLARAENALQCVTGEDFLAPYSKKAERYRELCAVVHESWGISVTMKDFLCGADADDALSVTVFALQFARLSPGDRLIVASCSYEMDLHDTGPGLGLVIAPDTVEFAVIEALG